ncbi:MAG: GntR family transcriptional regulator [Pseudomonadota bacterium]
MDKPAFKPALNLTEQIAEHLAHQIIRGQMGGGERIQELRVARDLDVSRGSVREALLILERRHLIEIQPRRGAVVNTLDAHDAVSLWELLAPAEQRWLTRLATAPEQLGDGAASALHDMEIAARQGDTESLLQARQSFYVYVLLCANKYTRAVFECLLPSSQRVLYALLERAILEHHDIARYSRALYEAIEHSDVNRLDELLVAFYRRLQQLCSRGFNEREQKGLEHNRNARPDNYPMPTRQHSVS